TAARNPAAAEAAEMQEGQPIRHAVDETLSSICGGGWLEKVGDLIEQRWVAQIHACDAEQQHERHRPDADRAVQVPHHPFPSNLPVKPPAAQPFLSSAPP